MTKKDYEVIARVFLNRGFVDGKPNVGGHLIAMDLADILAEGNPRFNRKRFLIACGVPLSLDE